MIEAGLAAVEQIFSPPFRRVFVKSLALTLLLLAVLWSGIEHLVVIYVHLPWPWLASLVHILAGAGLVVGLAFLISPVAFLVAGFFFDELADHVEDELAGPGGRGRAMPLMAASWVGVKFGAISLAVNALALVLLFIPGINAIAFFGANAYLLGRGFFELAAMRYLPVAEARALRRAYWPRILIAGCLPAALAMVPIANLLTPLFATALMIRIAQPLVRSRRLQAA